MSEIQNKEKILKAVREKQENTYKGKSIKNSRFLNRNFKGQEDLKGRFWGPEEK